MIIKDGILIEHVVIDGYETHFDIYSDGRVYNKKFKRFAAISHCREDYNQVYISYNNTGKTFLLHRLVAMTFIPNPENKPEVNHKNGDKSNNSIQNLEWVTREENIQHAYRLGLKEALRGEEHPNSTTTDFQVHNICQMLEDNIFTMDKIAIKNNVSKDVVHQIKYHKTWNHISKLYNIDEYNVDARFLYYSVNQIILICKELENNCLTRREISKKSNTNISVVNRILRGQTYKNISKNFKISNYNIDMPRTISKYDTDDFREMRELIKIGKSNNEIIRILDLEKNKQTKQDLASVRARLKI